MINFQVTSFRTLIPMFYKWKKGYCAKRIRSVHLCSQACPSHRSWLIHHISFLMHSCLRVS